MPLMIGTLLALLALSFVLYPLLASDGALPEVEIPSYVEPLRNQAIDALKEIEFDRATGKLSDNDYDSLKATYTQRAVDAMREEDLTVCPLCGPRPERDAKFCSRCGLSLAIA